MTCVVAWIEEDRVFMAADSLGSNGYLAQTRADSKIHRVGEFLIGYTSSFRMGQLLGYTFTPPEHPEGMDPYTYMVKHFVDALRTCLKDGGFATKNSEQEKGGNFLVGYRGRLFEIESDYQVGETMEPFNAVGSGSYFALASMHTMYGLLRTGRYYKDPIIGNVEARLRIALEASEAYCVTVRGPFKYSSV